jgi:hypothetical protein
MVAAGFWPVLERFLNGFARVLAGLGPESKISAPRGGYAVSTWVPGIRMPGSRVESGPGPDDGRGRDRGRCQCCAERCYGTVTRSYIKKLKYKC